MTRRLLRAIRYRAAYAKYAVLGRFGLARQILAREPRVTTDPWMLQYVPQYTAAARERLDAFRELFDERYELYKDEGDPIRINHFIRLLGMVSDLPGDYVELGTQHGSTARIIWRIMDDRSRLYCFDTFEGFTQADLDIESNYRNHGWTTDSIPNPQPPDVVRQYITNGHATDRLVMVPGRVPETFAAFDASQFRFAHLDMDLFAPTKSALEWLWPRMTPGGILFLHDYDCLPTVKQAADEFLEPYGLLALPVNDRFGSAVIFKPRRV